MSYVIPSAERGAAHRLAMDASLARSAASALASWRPADEALAPAQPAAVQDGPARALDYGAYFDLVFDISRAGEAAARYKAEAASHLAQRLPALTAGVSAGVAGLRWDTSPAVTNLSPGCYSETEIARLVRWWDTEPGIDMELTAATDAELEQAFRNIAIALDRLRQCAPELSAEFDAIVRDIVITRSREGAQHEFAGGVTSFALWGAMAIDAVSNDNWLQMFRSLAHEEAHSLLFAIAHDEPLVSNDPAERYYSPLRSDPRPMDGVYHGGYVSVRESLALDNLLCWHKKTGALDAKEADFAEMLLEGSVNIFWECDAILRDQAKLTPLGDAILAECESFMQANFALEPA